MCIVQPLDVDTAELANARLLDELSGGVGGVDIRLPVASVDPARLFEGVYVGMIAIHLSCGDAARLDEIAGFVAHTEGERSGGLHLGVDPFAAGAADPSADLAAALRIGAAHDLPGTWLSARGQGWHGAGAAPSQQIAIALATTAEYLRRAEAGGLADPATVFARTEYRLVADQNQFLTIARLRAFRRLHALMAETCGFAAAPAFVHAEAARRMMTKRDPWVNILRATVATFAAATGGADAISTLPHTALLGLPDDDARRLSRNVQTVLMEESNIFRVADPAAGSGGIEALTDALAERAWDEFRRIEAEGGLAASLASGALSGRIAAHADASRLAVARRREPITGTSTWPLLTERRPSVAAPLPQAAAPADAVPAHRIAEPWEALRDASDAHLAATGARPAIFLANLGPVSAYTLRSTWAKNLFEAGGIEAEGRGGHLTGETLADAFAQSGARIACLCSSDAAYETLAQDAARALAAAGAAKILMAGRPGEREADWRAAGVSAFVHEGLDMIALLRDLLADLGVALPAPGQE
ncbi:methylmalonyl-CoA mutase family protein [Methylobrevis pamukkalensis]|uniref:Methylmalonyl-CoA mutase small subunit n=1 Tax=Methylobrevis pamukkalensis TaxID=1439726 RepID=A0A1E3H693_9HYPH|nr:methylmalonyl-CoA mutase family protein [Methylobrevis pamukkalensis]ODN71859.1 Methylmalonyl-CoA mutase small subunit [Methylobrevis pamukkalensis]